MKGRNIQLALIAVLASSGPAASQPPSHPQPAAPASAPIAFTFDADAVGGPANGMEPVIGDWLVGEQAGARGYMVDGSRWRSGTPSASLADQARRLYGERYAEFLDGVRAFAFFPLAIADRDPPSANMRISVRFYPFGGRIDQGAGIAFDVQPNGNYAVVRANALEDNILWARVVRGRRTILDTVRNVPTPTRTWHTLVVTLRGTTLDVELDGTQRFHRTIERSPGRVGLWSKADSQVLFDDFRIEPLP